MWYHLSDLPLPTLKPIRLIDIDSRVVAYGDGFFTTMAVIDGQINWLGYHLDRIDHSLHALQLTLAETASTHIADNTRTYFETRLTYFAETLQQGMLKLIVCRKNQPIKGYGFSHHEFDAFIKLMPSNAPLAKRPQQIIMQPAVSAICLTQQIACLPKPLAGLKLLNAQDKVMASHELWQHQTQQPQLIEGLVQDVMDHWVEGTFCNVFYQLAEDSTWYTPPITQSGVKGVMRQVLLDNLKQSNMQSSERPLASDDLANINRLFFCNAVRGILPIQTLILPTGQSKLLEWAKIFEQGFS